MISGLSGVVGAFSAAQSRGSVVRRRKRKFAESNAKGSKPYEHYDRFAASSEHYKQG